MPNIVSELLKIEAGKTRYVLGAGLEDLRQGFESLPPDVRRPIVLLKQLEAVPSTSKLINHVLMTLATAARNLWPVWFTDVDFGLGISAADRAAARSRVSQLSPCVPGLSPIWGRKAVTKVIAGQLPLFNKLPKATQLHQLRLAISRTGLVLVMALSDAAHTEGSLFALTSAILWLARNAKLAVAVLVPPRLDMHPALAQILFDPIVSVPGPMNGDRQTAGFQILLDSEDLVGSTTVWVWLGEGRTHAQSAGEAKLAKALMADAELCRLFSANQSVETIYRNRPTVDLLWREGRVVVEVDGNDHRMPQKYAADRRRDFELGISDYHVLRLVNEDIITDTAKAVAQIREVVRFRRRTLPDLKRLP